MANNLFDENEKLKRENAELKKQNTLLKRQSDNDSQELVRLKRGADENYRLAIKRVSDLMDSVDNTLLSGMRAEERRTIERLKVELKNIDISTLYSKETCERLQSVFGSKENVEVLFDLEEAINPTEKLDLETLCKELGVFGG